MATVADWSTSQLRLYWSRWGWAIKLSFSITLLWFVIGKSGSSLSDIHISEPAHILLAALVLMVQPLINIPRLSIVLSALGHNISISKLVKYFYIGCFFNQVLPATCESRICSRIAEYELDVTAAVCGARRNSRRDR